MHHKSIFPGSWLSYLRLKHRHTRIFHKYINNTAILFTLLNMRGETLYCPEGYWNFATFCPCPIIIYISLRCRVVLSAARIRYRSTRENSTKIATQHAGNHIAEASAISIRDLTEHLDAHADIQCVTFLGNTLALPRNACHACMRSNIKYHIITMRAPPAPVIRNTHMWRSAACSNDIYMWEREKLRSSYIKFKVKGPVFNNKTHTIYLFLSRMRRSNNETTSCEIVCTAHPSLSLYLGGTN
jgi:hypothetical protein